jgi:hypothetical protein
MILFIMGWLRTTDPKERCRVLLTFNPPSSAEGEWLLADAAAGFGWVPNGA